MAKKNSSLIFFITFFAYTSIYIARLNLTVASPELKNLNVLSPSQIGVLGGVFSVVYAVGRLLNGAVSDKLAPYTMICTGLVVAGISNILISLFPPFFGMVILWSCNAFAQSMLWSSVLCVVTAIYDGEKAKKMSSYMVTSVAVGNILGIIIGTVLVSKLGVSFAFVVPGLLTIVSCIAVYIATHSIKANEEKLKSHISVFGLFKNKDIAVMSLPAMLHGVIKDNVSLWMSVFFVDRFNINLEKSSLFVLFVPLTGFVGRLAYPFIYKLCKNRENVVSVLGFAICIVSSVLICVKGISPVIGAVCLSLIYASISMVNTTILSIFPISFKDSGNVASVSGIMDFLTYFGAGVGSLVFGYIIEKSGYSPMFIIWAVISAVSIIVLSGKNKLLKRSLK